MDDLLGLRHLQEQKYKKRLALGEDKQCMMLARNCCTPVDYWLSMTLAELQVWIDANNDLFDKDNAKQ